jgi:hypothetical protein
MSLLVEVAVDRAVNRGEFLQPTCPEPVPSEPHRLMRNVDAALVEQVLHVPERQWIPDNHHHREADDLGARFEIPKNAGAAHPVRLAALPFSGKPILL